MMSIDHKTELLLTAPVPTVLWKLATPNVAGVAMMTAVAFFDVWFVGRLGNQALASLALVFPFLTVMQMMSAGAIGGATTSSISRYLGKSNISEANSAAWHAIIIAIVLSLIYSMFFLLFPDSRSRHEYREKRPYKKEFLLHLLA